MSTPRCSPNVNIVNGKLYVMGGDMNVKSLNMVASYDHFANDGPPIHRCLHLGTRLLLRWQTTYEGMDIIEKYDPVSGRLGYRS